MIPVIFVLLGIAALSLIYAIFYVVKRRKDSLKAESLYNEYLKESESPTIIEDDAKSIDADTEIENDNVEAEEETILEKVDDNGKKILFRYNWSFTAKMSQAPETVKDYYNEIKNKLVSKKVTNRISWHYETFRIGRKCIAKIAVRGKTLCLYLSLDPKEYDETKYHVIAVTSKKYEDVPCLYKIKNGRRSKYALELISIIKKNNGLDMEENEQVDYASQFPYKSIDTLVSEGFIKELVSKETYDEYMLRQNKAIVDTNKRSFVSANEVDKIIQDEVATTLVERKTLNYKLHKKIKAIVNVDTVSSFFNGGEIVNLDALKEKGIVNKNVIYFKVLARGTLDKELTFEANEYSTQAIKMVLLTGGKVVKLN